MNYTTINIMRRTGMTCAYWWTLPNNTFCMILDWPFRFLLCTRANISVSIKPVSLAFCNSYSLFASFCYFIANSHYKKKASILSLYRSNKFWNYFEIFLDFRTQGDFIVINAFVISPSDLVLYLTIVFFFDYALS